MLPAKKKVKYGPLDGPLEKYWHQRYNLFSRFDDGIQLDEDMWFSVTPENIAKHIAERVKIAGDGHILIVDGFCGVGGNLIQFALLSPYVRVIGCDINLERLKMAKNNAKVYGVQHQCEFIAGDFMAIMKSLRPRKVDAVFLSPPWGGIGYKDMKKFTLDMMTPDGYEIVNECRKYLTDNIAFLIPRNIDIAKVQENLLDTDHPTFECEENRVGRKVKTITLYFGNLIEDQEDTSEPEEGGDKVENSYDSHNDSCYDNHNNNSTIDEWR